MILIVDSGSTKTDWTGIDNSGKIIFESQTLGLNPQVLNSNIIRERIVNNYDIYKYRKDVDKLYFYGAGCGTKPPRDLIQKVFEEVFINTTEISVKEDTFAAIYATAEIGKKSIVCIIGTGSNCTYFDGENVDQKITSLGYILMDDASGNYFGRQLLRDYYFNRIPEELAEKFEAEFDLSAETIKDKLYKQPNPNTYLAKFAKFLINNKDSEYSKALIKKGLESFIESQIMQFSDAKEVLVHFSGSISFYLKNELESCLNAYNLSVGNIIRRPIDGLLSYHRDILLNDRRG